MTTLVLRRLLQTLPMLFVTGTVGFLLVHAAPGDPAIALSGEFAHEAVQREMRESYGLDRPLASQFVTYWRHLARGDLGRSYFFQGSVTGVILDRLPATLLLVLPALFLSTMLGVGIGSRLAELGHPSTKRGLLAAILASNAMPVFWLAQILLLVLAVHLGWFPVQGMVSPRAEDDPPLLARSLDVVRHLALPLLTMTMHQTALIVILTWSGVERELRREYVRAARSRGLPPRRVRRDALRNALLPIVTAVGNRMGAVLTGAVLTETVFAWPGLGRLAVVAATSRDYPLVLGLFLFSTLAVLLANLVTDVTYGFLDPRVRVR